MKHIKPRYGRLLGWALLLCSLLLWMAGCRVRPPETEVTAPPDAITTIPPDTTAPPEDMAPPPLTLPPSSADTRPIPVLSVVTEGEALILSRAQYIKATLTVYPTADSSFEENVTLPCSIRGRGHSSFQYSEDLTDYKSKNSYRVKLEESAALLPHREGERDRDWVLISCKNDASALRNHLVWDLARRMGTLPYVPDYTWVELYLNGDYRGLYLLTEQIEVDGDRVDIDDRASTDPADVGYLLEYDFRGDIESNAREGLTYFYLPDMRAEVEWVIKSEVYTERETAAIRAHLLACHEAILSGDRTRMEELIDIPSFVDMFILQELSKNPDVGSSSFYVQRDAGGKLYMTAPWDFDLGFGTYSAGVSPMGLVCNGDEVPPHPWFATLIGQSWFVEAVQARMEEISPLLTQTLSTLDALEPTLTPAADRNHERWGIYGVKYNKYVSSRFSIRAKDYADHVKLLKGWIEKRISQMNLILQRAAETADP